ncbi:MAG: tetratricopeptide repeat protein [Waterburya sp.]
MKSSSPNKTHWLDIAETSAVVGSIGGSITSIIFKQWLWVTLPLSVTAGLAVVNHQRLKKAIASEQAATAVLIQENQDKITQLKQQSEQKHWDSKVEISELKKASETATAELERLDKEQKGKLKTTSQELQTLQVSLSKLDSLTQKLEQEQSEAHKLSQELKAIDKFSQIISNNPNSVEAYYQRGSAYKNTGGIERAIEDFSKVIELCNDHAEAYHQRGLLYMEIADAKKAILDFRRASQYYIGKGELEKYRKTRDLSLELHFNQSSQTTDNSVEETIKQPEKELEAVVVNNLFG